jgi:hypothetical protein
MCSDDPRCAWFKEAGCVRRRKNNAYVMPEYTLPKYIPLRKRDIVRYYEYADPFDYWYAMRELAADNKQNGVNNNNNINAALEAMNNKIDRLTNTDQSYRRAGQLDQQHQGIVGSDNRYKPLTQIVVGPTDNFNKLNRRNV